MVPQTAGRVANSVSPDQVPRSAASDLYLQCLPRPACPKTKDEYGNNMYFSYCKIVKYKNWFGVIQCILYDSMYFALIYLVQLAI